TIVAPDAAATTFPVVTAVVIATAAPPAAIATTAPTATATATAEPTPTEAAEPAAEPTTGTAVTIDALNLRAAPSIDADILLAIPAGDTVVLTGEVSDGFVSVEYAGVAGWVAVDFLDLDGGA
ncbi:MAG: SH3 domain-containing protein, partial [Chloroflexia bacterium]|nr:SH3 domain-containing protein [Chloroflexia bacterium]